MRDVVFNHKRGPENAGYHRAVALLDRCSTPDGFLASPTERANYRRIWGRDGVILGLAALMSGEDSLRHSFRRTLMTLARHQGPHGEIPSNVDMAAGRVSYGGTAGRVDADLWFVIGCGQYWRATGDEGFLDDILPAVEKVRYLLGAWEFNTRGLLYVPQTGDWADEYIHHGYVLYDQLLYLQSLREIAELHRVVHGSRDHQLEEKRSRLKHLIQANYWFNHDQGVPDDVYHDVLYKQGRDAAPPSAGKHWMSFFAPQGFGYRFDALANVLVSLLGVANDHQSAAVDRYIADIVPKKMALLPAFHPIIEPVDRDWSELHMTFSYSFKNNPYEYHNGGLWPMVTGFYVADLIRRGRQEAAERFCRGIDQANALAMGGEDWSFPEYVHGEKLMAGGTCHQGWSAAAAVMAHQALKGEVVFRGADHGH
jgi:glycogen debranching enzyme